MTEPIHAIIVDDEFQNQILLKELIQSYTQSIKILQTFNNVKDAAEFININSVDVVFLDIEMPNQIGLKLFDLCKSNEFITIIVSAYDRYALPAIKEGVFDYLLKPIQPAELKKTIQSIINNFNSDVSKIKLLNNGRIELVDTSDIIAMEASGAYTQFNFKSRPRIVQSHHLAFYEKHLPEDQFIRVHRSSIINTAEIKSINRTNKTLILTNDHNIKYSIRKWGLIKHLIETEKR
jgi:two-component system LytT family response regulator